MALLHRFQDVEEDWDADLDLPNENFGTLRNVSTSTEATNSGRNWNRDTASRMSMRSDVESVIGEERQVMLPDDEQSIAHAIKAAAATAGIPLPTNVPASALVGGTIKRLGAKRSKQAITDEWDEDLDISGLSTSGLKIKAQKEYPASIDAQPPRKMKVISPAWPQMKPSTANLDRFKDIEGEDDDFFGDHPLPDISTRVVSATRSTPQQITPKTPAVDPEELEWTEGSLGTRYGGTTREHRRKSSFSAMSPSQSSYVTGESDDEGLDGLVLPEGPLKLDASLRKKQSVEEVTVEALPPSTPAPAPVIAPAPAPTMSPQSKKREDFFAGIEIGEGDVFTSKPINRNVKQKVMPSPNRRTAASLTFTNKNAPKIGRPPSSMLEPVAESTSTHTIRRAPSRNLISHSAQSSISTTSSAAPSTPRTLTQRTSMRNLRGEAINSPALKVKRSMPSMPTVRRPPSPSKPGFGRPASRNEPHLRPKTPAEMLPSRRLPFSRQTPQTKTTHQPHPTQPRHTRQNNSQSSTASDPRSYSRTGRRSPSPRKRDVASEKLSREAAAKRTVTRPTRRQNFGDGTELEAFDDLPTNASSESRFTKAPIGKGAPRNVRQRVGQVGHLDRAETPTQMPPSPMKNDFTPRFARDTAASRNAREQRLVATPTAPHPGPTPLGPSNTNWRAKIAARSAANAASPVPRPKPTSKPQLIKPMGQEMHTVKNIEGMVYNPRLYKWEGNENAVSHFEKEVAVSTPPPRPALITNVSATKNVQVVGEMVFDPQRMCWLKMSKAAALSGRQSRTASSIGSSIAADDITIDDDEEDPFANIPDLPETSNRPSKSSEFGGSNGTGPGSSRNSSAAGGGGPASYNKAGGSKLSSNVTTGDWLVGEEFDVGPEFVRRQREEEERWKKKVEGWIGAARESAVEREGALRRLLMDSGVHPF